MSASTRRRDVAALLGGGLVAGLAALPPLHAAKPPPLRLPEGPMRLLRVLERGIGNDRRRMITVRRWWEVTFERAARGIVAHGRQLGAAVEAPPQLTDLARIEEQRDASGMFPLMLTERGTIITAPGVPDEGGALAAALRAAEALVARQPLPAGERARIARHLGEVHRAGAGLLDALPGDLLFPAGGRIDRSGEVPLPEGRTGRFALSYNAHAAPDAPWLARAERRVVTSVGGLERRAAEVWTLEAA
jgi:hypothetical protein